MCVALDCLRVIHESCYMVVTQSNKDMDLLPAGMVVCTKKGYKNYLKGIERSAMFSGGFIYMMWDRDGRLGVSDPSTPMSIFLEWWMSEGNYAKYRGTNNNSETKKNVAFKLAIACSKVSMCIWTRKSVLAKIKKHWKSLEGCSWLDFSNWVWCTGNWSHGIPYIYT